MTNQASPAAKMASNPIFVTARKPLPAISFSEASVRISDRLLDIFVSIGQLDVDKRHDERDIQFTMFNPSCIGFDFTAPSQDNQELLGFLSHDPKSYYHWKLSAGVPFTTATSAPKIWMPLSPADYAYQDDHAMAVIVNNLFVRAVSVRP